MVRYSFGPLKGRLVAHARSALLGAALLIGLAGNAHAEIWFDNTVLSAAGGRQIAASIGPLYASFSTGSQAQTYDLATVELFLSASNASDGGSIAVDLLADTSPSSPSPGSLIGQIGTILDSAITSASTTSPVAISLTPTQSFVLSAGTRYWLELTTVNSSADWSYAANGSGTTGVATEYTKNDGGAPIHNYSTQPYLMQVSGDPVPEPASAAVLGVGLFGLALTRRLRKRA